MPISSNTTFKMLTLRGALDGLSIDPSSEINSSLVISALEGFDPFDPTPEAVRRLAGIAVLEQSDLNGSLLARMEKELSSKTSIAELREFRLEVVGQPQDLASVTALDLFKTEHTLITDSWLKLVVTGQKTELVKRHIELLRIASIANRYALQPDALRQPGVIPSFFKAAPLLPKAWRTKNFTPSNRTDALGDSLDPNRDIKKAKKDWAAKVRRISLREEIQSKANAAFSTWRQRGRNTSIVSMTTAMRSTAPIAAAAPATPLDMPTLDAEFYRLLRDSMDATETAEFTSALGAVNLPSNIGDLLNAFDNNGLINDTNNLCARIRVWESDDAMNLPEASTRPNATTGESWVRPAGWGDLIVVEETLVGYEAREVAHLENVLAGEIKVREHERIDEREETIERETEERSEAEKDLQTSDRFELQLESQKTIEEEFALSAGVNTSGRYGLTKVETQVSGEFAKRQSEAQASSTNVAREVVARAVERSFESVRERRRTTMRRTLRELNTHTLDNVGTGNGGPSNRVGIYRWVDKVHELQLRHYGTRLMVECNIPEPGLSLVERDGGHSNNRKKPAPLTIGPKDINWGNYLCLAKAYGVTDIEPPPPRFVNVGWSWASSPDEEANMDKSEDTVSASVTIPNGYRPSQASVRVSTVAFDNLQNFWVYVAVAGETLLHAAHQSLMESDYPINPSFEWASGVPISVAMHGHFDKTAVAQIVVRCERVQQTLEAWKISTWERLKAAHQALEAEYERDLAEEEFEGQSFFENALPREDELRTMERNELKKWAIKAMRQKTFEFDAVELVQEHAEITRSDNDLQQQVIGFFEQAFEWREMSYFLYPYYWGRRDAWRYRRDLRSGEARHDAFLSAGACRVVLPVTPGFEERVMAYLESDPTQDEIGRLTADNIDEVPADSSLAELWLELLLNRRENIARGSGTLKVQSGSKNVEINADSTWVLSGRDRGREVFIDGDRYVIASVASEKLFILDRDYDGTAGDAVAYGTGSVPYGPPWLVKVPTDLVLLADNATSLGVDP